MKKNIIYLFTIAMLSAGCKDFKKSIDDTLDHADSTNSVTVNAESASDSYRSYGLRTHTRKQEKEKDILIPLASRPDQLEYAEKELRRLPQFKDKSIFIYKFIHFYGDGRIITTLQNPENPAYVDEYIYEDGRWLQPKAVVLSKHDDVKGNLVSLDRLSFKNANHVFKVLEEKRKEIGSKDPDYTIYAGTGDNIITWYPGAIGNDRSVYSIEYNQDGTLKSFEQK